MKKSTSSIVSHSGAYAMTGYLFQARYALLRALEEGKRNSGHALSIERFDDISFDDRGEPIEIIQTKHHTKPSDISDMSTDLWKTLRVWITLVNSAPISVANMRLVFLTTSTAADRSALSHLRYTDNQRDIPSAVEKLIIAARVSNNQKTQSARDAFLALDDASRTLLVQNIWVFDNAPNIIDVRNEIETILYYSAPRGKLSIFTDYLEGWWFSRIISALMREDTSSSRIFLTTLQKKVLEIQEEFSRNGLPLDETIDAMPPVETLPDDDRIFVRQMQLVGLSEAEKLLATHDYYRAFQQRSRWARENLLIDGESDRYDRALWEAWRRNFIAVGSEVDETWSDSVKRRKGKRIFHWASRYSKPLRDRDELWLSAGSFQMLADLVRIGWHLDYESLLNSNGGAK